MLPTIVLLCLACYLVGALPFGYLIGRLKGVDIRQAGSGNIGATNVGRLLGRKWGILAFMLDVAKGLGPTLAAGAVLGTLGADAADSDPMRNVAWLACGVCCILGHNFPVYLAFRGGKGVATSLGVVLGVYPYLTLAGLLAFAIWVIVALTSRYVSLGSIAAAAALPVLFAVITWRWGGAGALGSNWPVLGFAVLAAGLVIYRHRGNISRLRAGTESRMGGPR